MALLMRGPNIMTTQVNTTSKGWLSLQSVLPITQDNHGDPQASSAASPARCSSQALPSCSAQPSSSPAAATSPLACGMLSLRSLARPCRPLLVARQVQAKVQGLGRGGGSASASEFRSSCSSSSSMGARMMTMGECVLAARSGVRSGDGSGSMLILFSAWSDLDLDLDLFWRSIVCGEP